MTEEKPEFWIVLPGDEEGGETRYLREHTALTFVLSHCETCIWLNKGEGLTVQVNCSDTFAWGCADSEDIESEEELGALCETLVAWPKTGGDKWCSFKRNEQPQAPVVKFIKDAGEWCERMESLPFNYYDCACELDNKRFAEGLKRYGATREEYRAYWLSKNADAGKTLTPKQLGAGTVAP